MWKLGYVEKCSLFIYFLRKLISKFTSVFFFPTGTVISEKLHLEEEIVFFFFFKGHCIEEAPIILLLWAGEEHLGVPL